MIDWSYIIGKIVSTIMSWADSANLRNRVFEIEDEHEILWTAIDDISRMYPDHPSGKMAKNTLKLVKNRYDRNYQNTNTTQND